MLIKTSLSSRSCGLVTFAFLVSSGGGGGGRVDFLCRLLLCGRSSSFGAGPLLCLLLEGPQQWAEHLEGDLQEASVSSCSGAKVCCV